MRAVESEGWRNSEPLFVDSYAPILAGEDAMYLKDILSKGDGAVEGIASTPVTAPTVIHTYTHTHTILMRE